MGDVELTELVDIPPADTKDKLEVGEMKLLLNPIAIMEGEKVEEVNVVVVPVIDKDREGREEEPAIRC